jgi:signal transduction histidine kinase
MQQDHAIRGYSAQRLLPGNAPILLKGRVLFVARATWLLLGTLSVGLFLAAAPYRYRQHLDACLETDCGTWQLSPQEALSLHSLGFSPALYATYEITLGMISMLAYTLVAFIIFWRRSREGLALLAALWLVTFGTSINETSLASPFLKSLWSVLDQLGWVVLLPLFLLTFPDGRFVPRWTRWLFIAYLVLAGVGSAIERFLPHLFASDGGQVLWLSMQLTGIAAQVYRFRRVSDPIQRQQTKWVVFSLVATVLLLTATAGLLSFSSLSSLFEKLIEMMLVNIAFLIIPLAIGFSILRYRLWDIDLIISRTLIWGLLTGLVIGIYLMIVGGLGALIQARQSFIPPMIAAGVIALLFHPLQRRVRRGVNRLIYGQRDEPYTVLSQLGKRLEMTLSPEDVLPTIVETIAQTLKLPYVAITLEKGHEINLAAAIGNPVEEMLELPLTYQGESIGQLVCGARSSGETFNAEERRLLQGIASQAVVALHAVELHRDLQSSRERLVVAREEERRRIRRDLHDGLGPALASQNLRIGSARSILERDPIAAEAMLQKIERENTAALEEIRRLVYNLRPPALDELGLLRAIQQNAPRLPGLDITFELPAELPELSAAVEVAVYRIVQEALLNIVNHSGATNASVQLSIASELRLTISDNGRGMPANHKMGVGLLSMRERAEELGGSFIINSNNDSATVIVVRLPMRARD